MKFDAEFAVEGPVDHVGLIDATWQGEPQWADDAWVALDAPDLVYQGPPFPGVLVRVSVPASASLRVAVRSSAPAWTPTRILTSELIVGEHGFALFDGRQWRDIRLVEGNYPLEVWVDPIAPGTASAVALILGQVQPRRLPDRLK